MIVMAARPSLPAALEEAFVAVDQPIEHAVGMPNEVYTSPDFFALEREVLFAPGWTCVGFASDLPEPGDARPVNLLGVPLFAMRDAAGAINLFHNVCSHRGHPLVESPRRIGTRLQCPYHAWSYDFDGRLRATPSIGGPHVNEVAGFDKRDHGLKRVRSATWLDLVFVNLSGNAPPLEDTLAPVTERWRDYDLTAFASAPRGEIIEFDVKTNWKLAIENYLEAYHLPWVHPELNRYSRLEDHYIIVEDGYAGQGSTVYDPTRVDGPALPRLSGLSEYRARHSEYLALYPSLMLGVHADHFFAVVLEATEPGRVRERIAIYYVGDAATADAFAPTRASVVTGWRSIFAEDIDVVEALQRGRNSPAFDGGHFSPVFDTPTHHFHRWVTRRFAAHEITE